MTSSVDQKILSAEELAEQCQAGCRDSFAALVERFGKRIFNFLCHYARNSHDAEDLTQETFLKAYQNIHRFDPGYSFSTWLFTIAKRTAISHFRAAKPWEQLPVDQQADLPDPAASLESKDEKDALWRTAQRLKPNQYEVLWLRYGEGFSIAEIARIMNTNQVYVKVLLHRARGQLEKHLRRTGDPLIH